MRREGRQRRILAPAGLRAFISFPNARPNTLASLLALILFLSAADLCYAREQTRGESGQSPVAGSLPKDIRGYKVERRRPKIRRAGDDEVPSGAGVRAEGESDLIRLGEPRVARITPFEMTVEVSVTVAAIEQRGQVDFLVFEDVRVAGTPVTVEDYNHGFTLPNDRPVTLPHPASIKVGLPRLALGALGQVVELQEELPVTGRVWVCGRFKKFFATFKRAVPVPIDLRFPNPLKRKESNARLVRN